MNKCFVLVVLSCLDGNTTFETSVFDDLVEAKIRWHEAFKYQIATAPKDAEIYDGYDHLTTWFEVGKTTDKYWARGEIQEKSL